jgi:hypothetical protein
MSELAVPIFFNRVQHLKGEKCWYPMLQGLSHIFTSLLLQWNKCMFDLGHFHDKLQAHTTYFNNGTDVGLILLS